MELDVNFKSIPYTNGLYMIRCKVDNEFFLECTSRRTGTCTWQHGMIYSWDKTGSVPNLTVLSEEELFQFTLVQEFSETEKMLAVQKYVLENIEFLKNLQGTMGISLEY